MSNNKGNAATRQDLVIAVGSATQAYQRATDGFDDAVSRAMGLNLTDLRCLDWLSEGPLSAGELSAATGLSSAATTTLLDRLEDKGYVTRRRDPEDRRKVIAELTPPGRDRIAGYYGPLAQEGVRLMGRLTDDELAMILDFLTDARSVVEAAEKKIRDELGR